MKNILKVTLGILTSIGGFLDAGAIATNAAARVTIASSRMMKSRRTR